MKGYTVHLLFHVLAIVLGAACGVAAGVWWFRHNEAALWLALAGAVAALLILILHGFYLAASPPPPPPAPLRHPGTGAMAEPFGSAGSAGSSGPRPVPAQHGDTAVQPDPQAARAQVDQETRRATSEALHEHGQS